MKNALAFSAAMCMAASYPLQAAADTYSFEFAGPGVSGTVVLTYGPGTDSTYPQAYQVTGISGTFSDSNHGLNIVNAAIGPLVPLNHATPEPTNLLAPNDFSKFAVTTGLLHGALSYDNLFYPGGSPQTASDYPVSGGLLDIYGLLFTIGSGTVVNLWSNGDFSGTGALPADYGVAVATSEVALDYVEGGVSVTAIPEPSTNALLMAGLGVLAYATRRRTQR